MRLKMADVRQRLTEALRRQLTREIQISGASAIELATVEQSTFTTLLVKASRSASGSLAAVGAADLNVQPTLFSRDAHRQWIAVDFTILDVAPADVELDEEFHLFATVRARHRVRVVRFHLPTFRVVCRA